MPLYDYHCHHCGAVKTDVFHPVSECQRPFKCSNCGDWMSKTMGCSIKNPNMWNYYSHNLKAHITGAKQRDRLMKQRGVIETGNEIVTGDGMLHKREGYVRPDR